MRPVSTAESCIKLTQVMVLAGRVAGVRKPRQNKPIHELRDVDAVGRVRPACHQICVRPSH